MISAVSFGSTYQVHSSNKMSIDQQFGYHNLTKFCKNNKIPYNERAQYNVKYLYGNTEYNIDTAIVAPDRKDGLLETFMAQKGVNYIKYETGKLIQPEAIEKRISEAPEGYKKVIVDSTKLNRILENQEHNNYHKTKIDYRKHHKPEAIFILKSGFEIPASTLNITTLYNSEKDSPKQNTIAINFEQKTNLPDNCMYMAMKDLGIKNIPVYMNDDSYNNAVTLGILAK